MVLRTNMIPTTPCLDCGTRLGAPDTPNGAKPARRRSLCLTCYEYNRKRGTLGSFAVVAKAMRRPHHFTGKLRHPGERRAEQRQRIAARVARHESRGQLSAPPVIEGDDFDHMLRRRNALHVSASWLSAHPTQAAEWDDPDLSTFPGSAQSDAA